MKDGLWEAYLRSSMKCFSHSSKVGKAHCLCYFVGAELEFISTQFAKTELRVKYRTGSKHDGIKECQTHRW